MGSNPRPSASLPKPRILRANLLPIKPSIRAISHLSSGLPIGTADLLFSERPVSLRSSGPHRFGTVLEIRTFQVTYELHWKEVLRLLSDNQTSERAQVKVGLEGSSPFAHSNLFKDIGNDWAVEVVG
jgi:hypothetical protein